MFKFITHRNIFINLLFGILIVLSLVVVFFLGLGFITNHGQTETVPNITGKHIDAARLLLEAKGFKVEVADSTWESTEPKLNVLKQTPEADAIVKKGRTIYLTVNKQVPTQVEVPALVGLSLKSALIFLKQYKLELGDTTFVPSFAKNTVEEMKLNGYKLAAGSRVNEGTKIDLVISSGPGDEIDVPNLLGLTYREALSLIGSNQLHIGLTMANAGIKDTMNAYVFRQSPDPFFYPLPKIKVETKIRVGQLIDVWLSFDKPVFDSVGVAMDSVQIREQMEKEAAIEKRREAIEKGLPKDDEKKSKQPNGAEKKAVKPAIKKEPKKETTGSEYD